jgi:hypothetical protein
VKAFDVDVGIFYFFLTDNDDDDDDKMTLQSLNISLSLKHRIIFFMREKLDGRDLCVMMGGEKA